MPKSRKNKHARPPVTIRRLMKSRKKADRKEALRRIANIVAVDPVESEWFTK